MKHAFSDHSPKGLRAHAAHAASRIVVLLGRANGRRSSRTMDLRRAVGLLGSIARGADLWVFTDGGDVPGVDDAVTTLALAARVEGSVYLGIAACDARLPSPAKAWPCLRTWYKGVGPIPVADAPAKWYEWATSADVTEVLPVELAGLADPAIVAEVLGVFDDDDVATRRRAYTNTNEPVER